MTHITTPGHENYNIVKPFHVHYYMYILNLSKACHRERKKRKTSNLHFLPQNYLPLGWRSWNLQFLIFSHYSYILNLLKIGPVVLEKNILTDDEQWMTDDHRCQPIAIAHLSDSGDLKRKKIVTCQQFDWFLWFISKIQSIYIIFLCRTVIGTKLPCPLSQ